MTPFIPDISHHQAGIDIQALANQGAAALIARVGQGAGRRTNGQQYGTTRDREWVRHRDESRRVGLPLVAYWYVGNLIDPDENARLAEAWVGDKTIPWMIDHEDASGDGAFYCATVDAFRRRGLRVIWGYVPNWYWAGAMARSDLRCGPPLVNSRYSTASGSPAQIYAAAGGDNGNGWINYGGQTTVLWQFTNKASMAGKAIDVSAFRGTLPQLLQMINGSEADDVSWTDNLTFDPPGDQPPVTYSAQTWLLWTNWYANMIPGLVTAVGQVLQAVTDDDEVTADLVKTTLEDSVRASMPTAEQVAAAQGDLLEEIIREVVPQELADRVVQRLGEKLAAAPAGVMLMPNLVGSTPQVAREALQAVGWSGQLTDSPDATTDPSAFGKITSQSPQAGSSITSTTPVSVHVATQIGTGG